MEDLQILKIHAKMKLQDGILGGFPICTHMKESGGWEGGCPHPLLVLPYDGAAASWAPNDGIPSGRKQKCHRGSQAKSRDNKPEPISYQPQSLGTMEPQSLDDSIWCPFNVLNMYTSFLWTRSRISSFLICPKQFGSDHRLNTSPCKIEALKLWPHPPWDGTFRNASITKACPSHFLLFPFFLGGGSRHFFFLGLRKNWAKIQRVSIYPHSVSHPPTVPPIINILQWCGTFVMTDEPILIDT